MRYETETRYQAASRTTSHLFIAIENDMESPRMKNFLKRWFGPDTKLIIRKKYDCPYGELVVTVAP